MELEESNQSAFLVFDSGKGMLKKFMSNFLTQFNALKRFSIYKVLVNNLGLAVHTLRKAFQMDFPYMGHTFLPEDKAQLLTTGNLGKTIDVTPKIEKHSPPTFPSIQ